MPGDSRFSIKVWDYNAFGGDDEIGETVCNHFKILVIIMSIVSSGITFFSASILMLQIIDLEERVLCPGWWQSYPHPIERRTLHLSNSVSLTSRGKLEMWLEMIPATQVYWR